MQELQKHIGELAAAIGRAMAVLKIEALEGELAELRGQVAKADFWADSGKAQEVMKQQAKLVARVEPWVAARKSAEELAELAAMGDVS